MASQALQRQTQYGAVEKLLGQHFRALESALPRMGQASVEIHRGRAQRAARVALQQMRTNPRLLDCDPSTLLGSVLQACSLGLELDGVLGQAYLVPYKDQCQMQVGYRGYQALALRSGLVVSMTAAVIYDQDEFEFSLGTDPFCRHHYDVGALDRGPEVCAWAAAQLSNGTYQFQIADARRIATAEKASKSGGMSPWRTYREAMVRKTAIRELAKYLPQSPDLIRAAVHDEYVETGHAPPHPTPEDFTDAIDVPSEEVADAS